MLLYYLDLVGVAVFSASGVLRDVITAQVPLILRRDLDATAAMVRVLADWCRPFPGFHLYYPSPRQPAPALALLVEALRCREPRPPNAATPRSR